MPILTGSSMDSMMMCTSAGCDWSGTIADCDRDKDGWLVCPVTGDPVDFVPMD
jgi:hypothetical protein